MSINDASRLGHLHRATVVATLVVVASLGALLLVVGTPSGQVIITHLGALAP